MLIMNMAMKIKVGQQRQLNCHLGSHFRTTHVSVCQDLLPLSTLYVDTSPMLSSTARLHPYGHTVRGKMLLLRTCRRHKLLMLVTLTSSRI